MSSLKLLVLPGLMCSLVVALSIASIRSIDAAAPSFVVVYGASSLDPIVISDRDDLHTLMQGISERAEPAMGTKKIAFLVGSRPSVEVALFWGPHWADYLASGGDPLAAPYDEANQRARIVFGMDSEPAVVILSPPLAPGQRLDEGQASYRLLPPSASDVLARYGISARQVSSDTLPDSFGGGIGEHSVLIGVGAVMLMSLVLGSMLLVSRARRRCDESSTG